MRVCVKVWQVRDTGALPSPSHRTGEYQPRGEHDCWGDVRFLERLSKLLIAVSSALLLMALVREFESRRGEILNLFAKI